MMALTSTESLTLSQRLTPEELQAGDTLPATPFPPSFHLRGCIDDQRREDAPHRRKLSLQRE